MSPVKTWIAGAALVLFACGASVFSSIVLSIGKPEFPYLATVVWSVLFSALLLFGFSRMRRHAVAADVLSSRTAKTALPRLRRAILTLTAVAMIAAVVARLLGVLTVEQWIAASLTVIVLGAVIWGAATIAIKRSPPQAEQF